MKLFSISALSFTIFAGVLAAPAPMPAPAPNYYSYPGASYYGTGEVDVRYHNGKRVKRSAEPKPEPEPQFNGNGYHNANGYHGGYQDYHKREEVRGFTTANNINL